MKKSILKISGICALLTIAFIACKTDEDTTAPVITLDGSNPYILENIGDAYVDPGFTATDNEDGTITSKVVATSTVNEDLAGTYTIDYSVSDGAGNSTTVTRTVIVQNSLETNNPQYKGKFGVSETCTPGGPGNYFDTLSFNITINNRIWFTRFANYTNGKVYADINGGTVTVPQQNVTCGMNPQPSRQFSGSGSISTVSGTTTMVLNITEVTNGTTTTCTETYTK